MVRDVVAMGILLRDGQRRGRYIELAAYTSEVGLFGDDFPGSNRMYSFIVTSVCMYTRL